MEFMVGLTVRVSSAKPSNMREISEKKMTLKYWLPAQAQATQALMQHICHWGRMKAFLGKAQM